VAISVTRDFCYNDGADPKGVIPMKILFTFCLLIVVIAPAVARDFALRTNPGDPSSDKSERDRKVEQELRSLVARWDEAYVKGDTATLDKLLADEFAFVGGQKKADYLEGFKTRGFTVDSAVSTDIEVQVYGDTAVLTGVDLITLKKDNQVLQSKWLYLDVWIRRGGRWQCVKTYASPAPSK
jgi:ketosteroid isomerase-like protein